MKSERYISYGGSRWFHGATRPRMQWSMDSIAVGNCEHGFGWYFTTSQRVADYYAHGDTGTLHQVTLRDKVQLISKTWPKLGGKHWRRYTKTLLAEAPDSAEKLENWAYKPLESALQTAVTAMLNCDTVYELFMNIWADFYRGDEILLAQRLLQLTNISGVAFPYPTTDEPAQKWLALWNPAAIAKTEILPRVSV